MGDWMPVMNPLTRTYGPGFGPKRMLEFRRIGSPELMRFRIADTHPAFNVLGLEWREPGQVEPWADFCDRYGVSPTPNPPGSQE